MWSAGLVLSVSLLLLASFELTYRNRAYPGIKVAGNNVGGLGERQITDLLKQRSPGMQNLVLVWGVNRWETTPADLGISYDFDKTARLAISAGRDGNIFKGRYLDPVINFDEDKFRESLASISGQINLPAKEPEITKTGSPPMIMISKGENGRTLNTDLLKQRVVSVMQSMKNKDVGIPVIEVTPQLDDNQIGKLKTEAEKLLGKELSLKLESEGLSWTVGDEQIFTWMVLNSGSWDRIKIKTWVEELAKTIDRPAQDASFRWVNEDRVEEFKPAREGLRLETNRAVEDILFGLNNLADLGVNQRVELYADYVPPEVTNEDVNNLGIKERVGKGESWFTGSITNRIFNLKKAADMINGKLVAPGETFSFNNAVGEISSDTGYKQAYIIKEGKTILGDGGGVCQVSTTLFRAALDAGLPIATRTPHAYRVSYYEVNYQPGFDATVFQPAPDFQFINDTGAYVLIQAVYDEAKKYLAFEIYGTSDGRTAEISKARTWEVVSPPPDLYIDDPNLLVGKVVQTEHAARGAKVAFDWKVTRNGEILQERTFFSNYRPWQAVYLRGTKVQ